MNVWGLARRVGIVVCNCHDTFPTCRDTCTVLDVCTVQYKVLTFSLHMTAAHLSCELRLSAMIKKLYMKWGPL